MKKLLTLLLILISTIVYGQQLNNTNTKFPNGLAPGNGTTNPTTGVTAGMLFYKTGTGYQYWDGSAWQTFGISGAGVTSFNSRTGAVVPLTGDYSSFYPLLNGTGATGTWGINITGTAPAGALTGTTLNSTVVTSSLTRLGTSFALEGGGTFGSYSGNTNFLYPGTSGLAITNSSGSNNNFTFSSAGIMTIANLNAGTAGTDSVMVHDNTTNQPRLISPAYYQVAGGALSGSLTAGYGLTGTTFTGANTPTWVVDTTSSTGIVSKSKYNTGMALKANVASPTFTGTVSSPITRLTAVGGVSGGTDSLLSKNGTTNVVTKIPASYYQVAGGALTGNLTFGTHLTSGGSSYNGASNVTITSDATNVNTVSTIVARDGSGNFSAGTITAALTGNASTATSSTLVNVTDDLTTNSNFLPVFSPTTGGGQGLKATSTKLTYNPSTGMLSSTGFTGALTGTATALATSRTIGTMTGDVTSAGSGFDGTVNNTNVATLATVNASPGTYGSATQTPVFVVNGKGLVTSNTNTTITPAVGSITGLGTGVATALAVNVGSAGAFVTFNGAGGTPSSLVGTNITGTASALNIGGNAATASTSALITTTDDLTTNSTFYPTFAAAAGGGQGLKITTTKLTFNPSTGILASTGFTGALNGTVGATTPTTGKFTTGTFSSLTSGRVPFASTAGLLTDNASLTYDGSYFDVGANTGNNQINVNGASPVIQWKQAGVAKVSFQWISASTYLNLDAAKFYVTGGNFITQQKLGVGLGASDVPLSTISVDGGLHVGGLSDAGDNNIKADGTITTGAYVYGETTASRVRLDNTIGSELAYNNYGSFIADASGLTLSTANNTTVVPRVTVGLTGIVTVGSGTAFSSNQIALKAAVSNANTSATWVAADIGTDQTAATSGTTMGISAFSKASHTSGNIVNMKTVNANFTSSGSGGTTDAIANFSSTAVVSNGTVTNFYGFKAFGFTPSGGSVSNKYSFYSEANAGKASIEDGAIFGGPIRLKGYTVATLPAGTTGDTAYVTDALAPTFLATVVGGGAVVAPVFYNGTNWVGY